MMLLTVRLLVILNPITGRWVPCLAYMRPLIPLGLIDSDAPANRPTA
jgi:hypothetical protein